MRGLPQHIYFERRRLITAGAMAFVAGFVLFAHVSGEVFHLPFPVFTGLLYAVSVIVAAMATTYLLPNFRRLVDCVAVSRLVFAGGVVSVQAHDVVASPFIGTTLVVGSAIVLLWVGRFFAIHSREQNVPIAILALVHFVNAGLAWLDNNDTRDGNLSTNLIARA